MSPALFTLYSLVVVVVVVVVFSYIVAVSVVKCIRLLGTKSRNNSTTVKMKIVFNLQDSKLMNVCCTHKLGIC